MSWTKSQERELIRLHSKNTMFFTEIAEKIGKPVQLVRWKAKQLGLESTQVTLRGRMGQWNAKHSHLRELVMTYFLDHTWEETRKKFKFTQSELKSLFTVAYRDPKFAHLRKDTRTKREWNTKDYKLLLQNSGIMPREWIGKKLRRGNAHSCIKERLQKLGVSSKNLNGITITQFREAFGNEPEFYIQTKAGPGRNGTPTYYKIIPWVWLDQEIKAKRLKTAKIFKDLIKSMALFQNWIFEGEALEKLGKVNKQRILRGHK